MWFVSLSFFVVFIVSACVTVKSSETNRLHINDDEKALDELEWRDETKTLQQRTERAADRMTSSSFINALQFSSPPQTTNMADRGGPSLLTLGFLTTEASQPIRCHLVKPDERQWKQEGGWEVQSPRWLTICEILRFLSDDQKPRCDVSACFPIMLFCWGPGGRQTWRVKDQRES